MSLIQAVTTTRSAPVMPSVRTANATQLQTAGRKRRYVLAPYVTEMLQESDEFERHWSIDIETHFKQESQLPLTDPRDAETQRMLNIPYRIIWY